jgi:hypothetical protein
MKNFVSNRPKLCKLFITQLYPSSSCFLHLNIRSKYSPKYPVLTTPVIWFLPSVKELWHWRSPLKNAMRSCLSYRQQNSRSSIFSLILWYNMIYLLTAIGLTPGGSNTVHIYKQTIHRTTQLTTLVGRLFGIRTHSGQTKNNESN